MKTTYTILTSVLALTATLQAAEPLTFDFKDAKGVNNVVFKLDAPLEQINGTATGVSGAVTVDPADLTTAKGKIVVATESLTVPNPTMREHLLSDQWLNAAKNPEITFEIAKVSDVKSEGAVSTAQVSGTFTLNGVSKEITVPAKVTYLPGKLADRTMGKMQGDLLVIRTQFPIKRGDYGIKPGEYLDKVSDEIDLSIGIAGAAPKK